MPVFSLPGAGDIRSHHKECVAGASGLQPGCAMHGVQVALQSCFWAAICTNLGQLGTGSGAVVENENGGGWEKLVLKTQK